MCLPGQVITDLETHYPYSRYLKETFGETTYKVPVASGLSCPTRDGALSKDGCAFCDLRGSASYFGKQGRGRNIAEQLRERIPGIRERFGARKFLAYFQSYTNTYAEPARLEELYLEALGVEDISGLCISTRPDCLPDPVLELLDRISQDHYISLELGIQSFNDQTLDWLKRGHNERCSIETLERLAVRAPRVDVCAHLILGAPTDVPGTARDAALKLNAGRVRGAKLHQLMILKSSELGERFATDPFPTLTLDQYSERVLEFLEYLSPGIYLERLCATASHKDECLGPDWSCDRWTPHNRIREFLERRQCVQGSKVSDTVRL
ncbi:MAG: TIGR01212 family radical SAM protein [Bdellovibrionales bacterium GWB1_55_8]|nr:MAG: TIGR01212 family radical SAM protein [Bdellovibrionales bacterium GWB1_55_8]